MTYEPTDALVEAAARAIHEYDWEDASENHWRKHPADHLMYYERARAALKAAFAAAIEVGEAWGAYGWRTAAGEWVAETEEQQHGFPCLILRIQEGRK